MSSQRTEESSSKHGFMPQCFTSHSAKTIPGIQLAKSSVQETATWGERQRAEQEYVKYQAKKGTDEQERPVTKAQNQARAEAEARRLKIECKAANAEKAERAKRIKDAKTRLKLYKTNKEAQKAEEKKRRIGMGGLFWGYDPNAGMKTGSDAEPGTGGSYIYSGKIREKTDPGVDQVDELGRRTGKRWVRGTTWGVEEGGPGKEGIFGHGSLKAKAPVTNPPASLCDMHDSTSTVKAVPSGKSKWSGLPESRSPDIA